MFHGMYFDLISQILYFDTLRSKFLYKTILRIMSVKKAAGKISAQRICLINTISPSLDYI